MKIDFQISPNTIKLKEPFTISRGTYSERRAIIVSLSANDKTGFGEAVEHEYYGVAVEDMLLKAAAIRSLIENYDFNNPSDFWGFLNPHLTGYAFLQNAIDCAAHDLYGKLLEKPCYEIWGFDKPIAIKSSFTLGIDSIDNLLKKIKSSAFDIYKIKLGTPNDMAIMKALCTQSAAAFRVDVNTGWSVEETIENAKILAKLGVEFIEQPLGAKDWKGMEEVHKKSVLPIIADEACVTEEDVKRCANYFDGINIKLMKCGGITPALRMIRKAKELNLKVMCGCMMETSIGISAIAQLTPKLDFVDMDSALLIANDIAKGAEVQDEGSIVLPKENGLGIVLNN